MKKALNIFFISLLLISLSACSADEAETDTAQSQQTVINQEVSTDMHTKTDDSMMSTEIKDLPVIKAGDIATEKSRYTDENGDVAIIPKDFRVSDKEGEHTVSTGLVVIGPDDSEFVWVPTTQTTMARRDFGSYVYFAPDFSYYRDDTNLEEYKNMMASTEKYGGFYMGRFEASYGGGSSLEDYVPASKRITDASQGRIWVKFSPRKATVACENIYAENETVQGFFPWGINYDTTLQWLIDSGAKTTKEVSRDSTSWGNYSNDTFSPDADGSCTGKWEETKANNIYDLAGNNWEWTQERSGTESYVMRGGGYNIMMGPCRGSDYPAALRDPLPGNDRHPNVAFRVALYVK